MHCESCGPIMFLDSFATRLKISAKLPEKIKGLFLRLELNRDDWNTATAEIVG